MYLGLHVKCPVFFNNFNHIWSPSTNFHKKSPTPNLTEICPVGTARTDGHGNKYNIRFSRVCELFTERSHHKQAYLPLSETKLGVLATVYCKFHALLNKNSDYLPEEHKQIFLCNGDVVLFPLISCIKELNTLY
jgi:hypothetical protein